MSPSAKITERISRCKRSFILTQQAVVTELYDDGYALVAVQRGTACGGACESCGGTCSYRSTLSVKAVNSVSAAVGDSVTIESRSSQVIGKAALVYLVPLIAFFAGYFLASAFSVPEAAEIIVSIAAFFAGTALVVFLNRRRRSKAIEFEIIGIN